jgi:hypothetical protein
MSGVNAAVLMKPRQPCRRKRKPEGGRGARDQCRNEGSSPPPSIRWSAWAASLMDVLRRPLMEAATQEFQIDGSWYGPDNHQG